MFTPFFFFTGIARHTWGIKRVSRVLANIVHRLVTSITQKVSTIRQHITKYCSKGYAEV